MSLPPLLSVPVTVPGDDYTKEVYAILAAIRPEWKPENIQIKVMSQGYANRLLCVSEKSGGDDDRLMVRIYGQNAGIGNCYDRESELAVLRVLAEEGVSTPIYCKFENGFVYGFASGDTLKREDMKDEKIRKGILQLLHRIHAIDYKKYVGELKRPGLLVFLDEPWKVIDSSDFTEIEADPRYTKSFPPLKELRQLKVEIHAIYDSLCQRYPLVYSHGDCHVHNIVQNKSTGKLTFIDWEDSNWCPDLLDVTTVFDRDPEFTGIFGGPEERRQILKEYLSLHPVHGAEAISDELLEKWYEDSLRTSLVTSFVVVTFCLVSLKTSTDPEVDFFEFGATFYNLFTKYKKELNCLPQSTK